MTQLVTPQSLDDLRWAQRVLEGAWNDPTQTQVLTALLADIRQWQSLRQQWNNVGPSRPRTLTPADYQDAAHKLGCEVAAVKAVVAVESRGRGFHPDGRPIILFEAHQFQRFTKGKYQFTHPHLSSPVWNRKLYTWGIKEWDRLNEAITLNETAAFLSASWGLFQVMGFNFKLCGFSTVQSFVQSMKINEDSHLESFIAYVIKRNLARHLVTRNWAAFAKAYNGAEYQKNNYDQKLANAYTQSGGK